MELTINTELITNHIKQRQKKGKYAMKDILKELYLGNISEVSANIKSLCYTEEDEEYKTYTKLCSTFNKEQKQLLDKYIDLMSERYGKIDERRYIQGFKTGLLIGIECSDLDLK